MFDKKEYKKQWRLNNPERVKENRRKWYKDNPEKRKLYDKKYFENNREIIKERNRQWRKDNPEKMDKMRKQWVQNNPEKAKQIRKQWKKDNPEYDKMYHEKNKEKILEYKKKWCIERRKINLKYKLTCRMRKRIWQSLKGSKKGKHWEDLVGYSLNDLIKRLKKTMPKGYTWQDFMEGKLEIDHRIPVSVFNFIEAENPDFKRCWSLENLQLLTKEENRIKRDKLYKPFQPALAI